MSYSGAMFYIGASARSSRAFSFRSSRFASSSSVAAPTPAELFARFRVRLDAARAAVIAGGGPARVKTQHAKGKLTARERVDLLADPGTFRELDALVAHRGNDFGMADESLPGDGVVTGSLMIRGRPAMIFSQDFTVAGGSLSETHAKKLCKVRGGAACAPVSRGGRSRATAAALMSGPSPRARCAGVRWAAHNWRAGRASQPNMRERDWAGTCARRLRQEGAVCDWGERGGRRSLRAGVGSRV